MAYPDGVGALLRTMPPMLELVLVPLLGGMVTNFVLVIVPGRGVVLGMVVEEDIVLIMVGGRGIVLVMVGGRGIVLVMVAGRGIELVLVVEGNESVNKPACKQPEVGDS